MSQDNQDQSAHWTLSYSCAESVNRNTGFLEPKAHKLLSPSRGSNQIGAWCIRRDERAVWAERKDSCPPGTYKCRWEPPRSVNGFRDKRRSMPRVVVECQGSSDPLNVPWVFDPDGSQVNKERLETSYFHPGRPSSTGPCTKSWETNRTSRRTTSIPVRTHQSRTACDLDGRTKSPVPGCTSTSS